MPRLQSRLKVWEMEVRGASLGIRPPRPHQFAQGYAASTLLTKALQLKTVDSAYQR